MCTVNSIGGEGFSETKRNLKRSQAIEAHPASFSQSKVKSFNAGQITAESFSLVHKQDESEMVTINGHQDVPKNDEKSLLKALAHHLSVSLFILLGVFDGRCGVNLDHGIAAVVWIKQGFRSL
ncbi:hypothetical protein F2Q70_00033768 [Brassica cretica]|uniref:Uncharacterized protein n=1 Tax=Brassica cretica TaxID=69181 RepID=A0A8S9JV11_BRACR|nr:hypothetical protein F2Q70_00033768 [Brassica cretica]